MVAKFSKESGLLLLTVAATVASCKQDSSPGSRRSNESGYLNSQTKSSKITTIDQSQLRLTSDGKAMLAVNEPACSELGTSWRFENGFCIYNLSAPLVPTPLDKTTCNSLRGQYKEPFCWLLLKNFAEKTGESPATVYNNGSPASVDGLSNPDPVEVDYRMKWELGQEMNIPGGSGWWYPQEFTFDKQLNVEIAVFLPKVTSGEFIFAISNDRAAWGEPGAGALTFRVAAPRTEGAAEFDAVWRSGVFERFLDIQPYQIAGESWTTISFTINKNRIVAAFLDEASHSNVLMPIESFDTLSTQKAYNIGLIGYAQDYKVKLMKLEEH